jgi:hypothetical protein
VSVDHLDLELHITKRGNLEDYSNWHRFCFAVIDLSKSEGYPSNFVCVLPVQIRENKNASAFEKLFGEKSVEQAKILLTAALKSADDSEIRVEIERRVKLLEPAKEIKCCSCGKMFFPRRIRRFRNNFCEGCIKKKFGNRE